MVRDRQARWALGSAFTLFAIVACAHSSASTSMPTPTPAQGWTAIEQQKWYRGSQGSRLIPRDWLLALEEARSAQPFLSAANVARFGYLPAAPKEQSPLPVGFAIDRTADANLGITAMHWWKDQPSGDAWVGMNCAACHTGEVDYQGQSFRIDGGPTLANFQLFFQEFDAALAATLADPQKFDRFAHKVLGPTQAGPASDARPDRYAPGNVALLHSALGQLVAQEQKLAALNAPEPDYGDGRLDAVGHIFNRVAYLAGAPNQFGGPSDAPVSYPFLWNINQHDFVQWDGIAPNKAAHFPSGEVFDAGAIVRNTSEVIGVFADVNVVPNAPLGGYRSSVNVHNLDAMEVLTGKLLPPAWPQALSTHFDPTLAKAGKVLFDKHCQACHAELDRTDLKTPIKAVMTPIWGDGGVGTDPHMACNAYTYQAYTGRLENVRKAYIAGPTRFMKQDFTKDMLVATAVGTLFGQKRAIAATAARAAFGLPREIEVAPVATAVPGQQSWDDRERDCRSNKDDKLVAYKGRPLNGIWATAPYLHNGSVRTLYQLLLPPERREKQFWVGNREFDPKDVGFVNAKGVRGTLFEAYRGKVEVPGNSNAGHDYGNAGFSDADRYALIEYMKSL